MATGDTVLSIPYQDFFNVSAGGEAPFGGVGSGLAKGIAFNPKVNGAAIAVKRMPATASLATGATVKILLVDDAANATLNYAGNPFVSQVIKFGVNFGVLGTSGAYVAIGSAALGTEATGTVTTPSTSGQTIELSIPIVVANMASCAANKWCLFQLRRLGADATDTGTGRIIVLGVTILDT